MLSASLALAASLTLAAQNPIIRDSALREASELTVMEDRGDGNPDNIVIENLALVNQQEMYYAGVKHGLTNDRELSRSIVALARLDAAIHNAEKKVKK